MSLEARLTIDLAAIVANWRALDAMSAPAVETAAVVKADAYGLGAAAVGPALAKAGVKTFFVALPQEGVRLREILGRAATIYILGGYSAEHSEDFQTARLRPVLNSVAQGEAWFQGGPAGPAALQIDTGMNRLGLERRDLAALTPLPKGVKLVMSHLACSDDQTHAMNAAQRAAFEAMTADMDRPRSLAATGGVLLGPGMHFDLVRPGIGLFGGSPYAEATPVVRLEAPVIQVRDVAAGEVVGYGATWRARRPARIATVSTGYADGIIRAAGATGHAMMAGRRLNYAGRVSMDLITLDVTHCPEAEEGAMVTLIGEGTALDTVAAAAGTIGYELLTRLGARFERRYVRA